MGVNDQLKKMYASSTCRKYRYKYVVTIVVVLAITDVFDGLNVGLYI